MSANHDYCYMYHLQYYIKSVLVFFPLIFLNSDFLIYLLTDSFII